METNATTQGFITEGPVYHIAKSERLTLCMLWVHGDPGQRRRKDEWSMKTAACGYCHVGLSGVDTIALLLHVLSRPELAQKCLR